MLWYERCAHGVVTQKVIGSYRAAKKDKTAA